MTSVVPNLLSVQGTMPSSFDGLLNFAGHTPSPEVSDHVKLCRIPQQNLEALLGVSGSQ